MATTISEAEYCLARVVEHGNAKEVFMALTTSVLQRLASSATASEADHVEPPPHELTGHPTTTTPPHPPVFTWPFLRTILSSLSSGQQHFISLIIPSLTPTLTIPAR
jgi:hypothetical protein